MAHRHSRVLSSPWAQLRAAHSRRTHARLLLALGGQERSPRGGAGGGWCGGGFRGTEGATWCAYRRREPELGDWDALWPTLRRSLQGGRRPPPRPRGRCFFCRGTRVGSSRGAGGCPPRKGSIHTPRRLSATARRPQLRGCGGLTASAEHGSKGAWRRATAGGSRSGHSGRTPQMRAEAE